MAFLDVAFDVQDLPKSTSSFDPLPAGWYTATITGADVKSTKAGNGQYIAIKYDIIAPTHQGRVVFGNINIKNPNPKAEEIGRQQLGEIMRAIGLTKVTDTDQLIGNTLMIKLEIRVSEQYGDSNDVKAYKVVAGNQPTIAPASAAPAPAAARAAPPWAKK